MHNGPDKRKLSSLESALGTLSSRVYWVDWQAQSTSSVYFYSALVQCVSSNSTGGGLYARGQPLYQGVPQRCVNQRFNQLSFSDAKGLSNPSEVETLREKVYATLEAYTKQKYPEQPGR